MLGHRGASGEAPENTLAAFRLSLEQGADGVELDVWRCGSGEVVVHHDVDTGRSAGRPLLLRASPWRALRQLDVGAWRGERWRGERIPLLEEVLEALPGAIVNVELKAGAWPDLPLAAAAARVIARARASERCLVSSFSPLLLAAFRARAPGVRAGLLVEGGRAWEERAAVCSRLLRLGAVHPPARLVTAPRAARWARRKVAVHAWTVDEPAEVRRLAALGVASIITNWPAAALEALAQAHP